MLMRDRGRRNQLHTEIPGCHDHHKTEFPMVTLGRRLLALSHILTRDRRPEEEFLMMKLVRCPKGKLPIAMRDRDRGPKFPMMMRKTALPIVIRTQLPIS